MKPFPTTAVAQAFAAYPSQIRAKLLLLRELIFQIAATTQGIGELEETLKWGEPAYLTPGGSGTTIRIAWKASRPDEYAMYFNCKTTLVESFRTLFPDEFRYEGNRAIVFGVTDIIPTNTLNHCITAALTYHSRKHKKTRGGH